MKIRGSVVVALVAVFVLAGCAPSALPDGPSAQEIDARIAAELDKQWGFTGLDGVVDRPVVPESDPSASLDNRRFDCMSDNGMTGWGWGDTGLAVQDREPTAEEQLVYYGCFAQYPIIDMLSTEQLDYIYGYYARFLVPCLTAQGYSVQPVSRLEFVDDSTFDGWRWTPYQALSPYPRDQKELDSLIANCPPALPGIDGWENHPY